MACYPLGLEESWWSHLKLQASFHLQRRRLHGKFSVKMEQISHMNVEQTRKSERSSPLTLACDGNAHKTNESIHCSIGLIVMTCYCFRCRYKVGGYSLMSGLSITKEDDKIGREIMR